MAKKSAERRGMLSQSSLEELREAAAEALLYVTFRCNKSKGQVLEPWPMQMAMARQMVIYIYIYIIWYYMVYSM